MPINKSIDTEFGAYADYFKVQLAIDVLGKMITIDAYGYISDGAYANGNKPIKKITEYVVNNIEQRQIKTPGKGVDADNNEIDIDILTVENTPHPDYDDLLAAIDKLGWEAACENYLVTTPQFTGGKIT